MFYGNIAWPKSAPLRDISCQNLSDLAIDLSRSLKANVIASLDSPYVSPKWPNSAPLQDIRLRNLSDLDSDLSRSLKVKCDLVYYSYIFSNHMSFSHR